MPLLFDPVTRESAEYDIVLENQRRANGGAGGRFYAALRAGRAYQIPKNRVQFIPFQTGDRILGIGLDDPRGGAVVAICSPAGAIMAHISPAPVPAVNADLSMHNLRRRMVEVVTLARDYQVCFPPCSFSLVVVPTIEGRMAIPQHAEYIRGMLIEAYLDPAITTYSMPVGREHPERGVVFVDGSSQQLSVYVEGRRIIG